MNGQEKRAVLRNPPEGWRKLFAAVPGKRSGKVRCLLCGRSGYDVSYWRQDPRNTGFGNGQWVPSGWMLGCVAGHKVQCLTCRRPFVDHGSLAHHLVCKLHHNCCRDHTTVPEWKNPFHKVVAA